MDSPPPYQEEFKLTNEFKAPPPPYGRARAKADSSSCSSQIERPVSVIESRRNDSKAWLCPHVGLNFGQAQRLFSDLPMSKSLLPVDLVNRCSRKVCNKNLTHHVRKRYNKLGNLSHQLVSTVTLFWAPSSPDPHNDYRGIFSLNRIATALHGLDFPICAHLRLNQTFILGKFSPECIYTKSHRVGDSCACHEPQLTGSAVPKPSTSLPRTCKTVGRCPACHDQGISTSFIVRVDESTYEDGQEEASLSICFARDLGSLETPNASAWLTSTVQPHELSYMASIWRDWEECIWTLRDEWFEPLFASNDPYPSITRPLINKDMPSPGTSDAPISFSNEPAPDLRQGIRKPAVRCMKLLMNCFTEPFEPRETRHASSKSKTSFRPWKFRTPGFLQSGCSHHTQVHAQRLPLLQASTELRSSL